MFYAWAITIPAGTPENDPVIQDLKLTKGIVTSIAVKFAAGCHGLARVRVTHRTFQLVPLSKGEWITGDDENMVTETYYDLSTAPTLLQFRGTSPGCTYDHTIMVRIQVTPSEVASPYGVLSDLVKILKRLTGA